MKKLSLLLLALLWIPGCVTKSDTQTSVPPLDGGTSEPGAVPSGPRDNRVALVLGGTGVASYATVGLLKKLEEENVQVEFIVATGWPAVFALARGFLKSIHDLEWFATRIDEKEFARAGSIDPRHEIEPSEALQGLILSSFSQTLLSQARIPVIIAATNTDVGEPDVYGSGEWKEPLLRTVSVPGIYRKFPVDRGTKWLEGIQGLEVREALRRGATQVVAVSMYDDYVEWLNKQKSKGEEELVRRLYSTYIRKTTNEAMKAAQWNIKIALGREPLDFAAKRAAILAGYREGSRLVKKLREPAPTPN